MCYHIDDEVQPEEAPELITLDLSPCSHVSYLQEKADRLRNWQVDLEAIVFTAPSPMNHVGGHGRHGP
jgi:hypothetical protein